MRAPKRPKVDPKLPTAKYDEGRPTRSSKFCVNKMSDSNIQTSGSVYLTCITVYTVQMYDLSQRHAEKIIYFEKILKFTSCTILE